jgi:hypothetical protein
MDIEFLTEKLTNPSTDYELILHLFSYFTQDHSGEDLNQTRASYVSKIITFMCLKRPLEMNDFLTKNLNVIESLSRHLYLTECIGDLFIKFVCLNAEADKIQYEVIRILSTTLDDNVSLLRKYLLLGSFTTESSY